MTRRLSRIPAAFFLTIWTASVAHATPVTYTFEPPNFTLGQMTTLANVAPNIGSPAFLTSFAASPTANGFSIVGGAMPPIPIFSGQFLVDTGGAIDTLLLTFNTPILFLQVDFLLNASVTTPPSLLSLVTPVGSTSQPGANVGGPLQGGTLIFSSAVPFVSAQLAAFNAAGAPIFFGIDDLVLDTEVVTAVPEPVTGVLLLSGLGLLARRRMCRT
jgi:hypothetical protein